MAFENVLRKNVQLKNAHTGRRCFIIGNGPSLNEQNITLLEGEISIAVNLFFSHHKANKVKPPYWVMADPLYWEDPDLWFAPAFNAATQSECYTKLFVPTGGFSFYSGFNTGPLIDLHFLKYDGTKDHTSIIDFTQGIPPYGQNVVIVCLMLAFYLGCNPIYLMGCDYDFARMTKNEYLMHKFSHFYGEDRVPTDHEYLAWEQWKLSIAMMDYQYEQLNKYATIWGYHLFNATRGGYLDVFPRVEYESLFTPGSRAVDATTFLSSIPDIISLLGQSALKLINEGSLASALVLIDEAISQNVGKESKVEGLDYLRSICLLGLGEHREAIKSARQDYLCNPSNKENSLELLKALGNDLRL